jgi:MFS transporter, DHA1 family, multidrug resistance protein
MPISYPLLAFVLAVLNAIGPFAIDTYLPAFPAIERGLGTTPLAMQQSLTAYMLPFSIMMLWHGAISDALGRKRVILVGLTVFVLASLVCMFAQGIEMLLVGRALQGMSAGVGVIVGRAVVRDVLHGPAAQRMMSHVAMVFSIAPAVAPIFGGYIAENLGWRAIFAFMLILALLQMVLTWRYLPETLPPEKRQSMHPAYLLKAYTSILGNAGFVLIALCMSFFFGAFFIYVMSAPVFLMQHLKLSATQFGWLFVPLVIGMMSGSLLAVRLSHRLSLDGTIRVAFWIAGTASLLNLLANLFLPDSVATRIPPLALHTMALNLAFPSLTLKALDMFPAQRGMAASCQGFIHTLTMALGAGVIAPMLWQTTRTLSFGMAVGMLLSVGTYFLARPFLARHQVVG